MTDHQPQVFCDDFDPNCPICPPMCFECRVEYPCPVAIARAAAQPPPPHQETP